MLWLLKAASCLDQFHLIYLNHGECRPITWICEASCVIRDDSLENCRGFSITRQAWSHGGFQPMNSLYFIESLSIYFETP